MKTTTQIPVRRWLSTVHEEARRAQDDPRRDADFQAWKRSFKKTVSKKTGGGRRATGVDADGERRETDATDATDATEAAADVDEQERP